MLKIPTIEQLGDSEILKNTLVELCSSINVLTEELIQGRPETPENPNKIKEIKEELNTEMLSSMKKIKENLKSEVEEILKQRELPEEWRNKKEEKPKEAKKAK